MTNEEIVANYYNRSCDLNKESWAAACLRSADDQYTHFAILSNYINWRANATVLEVGSGQGDYYEFLKARNKDMHYTGVDISDKMVEIASLRYPKAHFVHKDFLNNTFPEQSGARYDYVIGSGCFNLKVNNQMEYIEQCLRKMFSLCRLGAATTLTSDKGESAGAFPALYYYSPAAILDLALSITPKVVLNHGGLAHEMVLYLFPNLGF